MRKLLLIGLAVLGAVIAGLIAMRRLRAAPDEGIISEKPLDTMTRDELYELAREFDIPGRSKMKKTELRVALSRARRSG